MLEWRVSLLLIASGLLLALPACIPPLEPPLEQPIMGDRAACFRFVQERPDLMWGDAEESNPCDHVLASLGRLLEANPNDAWARTERAEVTHTLARERERYVRSHRGTQTFRYETGLEDWKAFLQDWNRTYPDLVYFRLIRQVQPELTKLLELRQQRLLADFFYLNGEHAERLGDVCSEHGIGCDADLLNLLAGELYHLSTRLAGEALQAETSAEDPIATLNQRLLRQDLCASWYLGYGAYYDYLNKIGFGTERALATCESLAPNTGAQELPEEIRLGWTFEVLEGSTYQVLSRFFQSNRTLKVNALLDEEGEFVGTTEQLRELLRIDIDGVTVQITADLLTACASAACEDFPGRVLSAQGQFNVWKDLWALDMAEWRQRAHGN